MRAEALSDVLAAVGDPRPAAAPAGDWAAYITAGVSRDSSKPFITWYDDGTGERVELSYATFANWVWKTANYLVDGLDVQPGDRVGVLLPTHWQTVVVWYAALAAGAVVVPMTADTLATAGGATAVFASEHALPALATARVRAEIVGLSLRPMAARLTGPPPGVSDFSAEVPGHGDSFRPANPPALSATAVSGRSGADLIAAAEAAGQRLAIVAADRLLCTAEITGADEFAVTVLAVFAANAGLVLAPRSDAARLERRCADERITVHIHD